MSDDPERRRLLQAAAALALTPAVQAAPAPPADPQPGPAMTGPRPATPTPGKPGDFDFLTGRWKILNHKRRSGPSGPFWDVFEGEATVHALLAGICSVEELRIPARQFSGLGLRLLDLKAARWSDFWVNAASGALGGDGLPGSFESGAGIFQSEEDDPAAPGVKVIYRSVWDRITPTSCRWQQGVSRDGGTTWALDWSMDWTRLG
jgi:hypothetical protein